MLELSSVDSPGIPIIPSALSWKEVQELRRLAEGETVLEIGALLGFSTIILADVAERVVSVDPHEGYPEDDPRPTLVPFLDNLKGYGVRHKVTVCVGRDEDVLPFLRPETFRLVFIDSTGRYEDTQRAIELAVPLLKHRAALAVHDCGHPDWPGALRAVQDFADRRKTEFSLVDRLAVFEQTWR